MFVEHILFCSSNKFLLPVSDAIVMLIYFLLRKPAGCDGQIWELKNIAGNPQHNLRMY